MNVRRVLAIENHGDSEAQPLVLGQRLLEPRPERSVLALKGVDSIPQLSLGRCHSPHGTGNLGICPAPIRLPRFHEGWRAVNKYALLERINHGFQQSYPASGS